MNKTTFILIGAALISGAANTLGFIEDMQVSPFRTSRASSNTASQSTSSTLTCRYISIHEDSNEVRLQLPFVGRFGDSLPQKTVGAR